MADTKKDDLYDDEVDQEGNLKKAQSEDEGSGATGLLPKSMFGGRDCQVGEEIVLKIAGIHDDQYRVEYSSKTKEKEEPESGEDEVETSAETEEDEEPAYQ